MELFLPNVLTVAPAQPVSTDTQRVFRAEDIAAPAGTEFKKVYFEELTKRCYNDNGNLDMLSNIARIHHEEYYGVGSGRIKRWRIFFNRYNILVNLEEVSGTLVATAL